jgi:phage protein D
VEKIIRNIVEISIAGKNVTGDVSSFLSKITYTDKVEAESDDVSLTFEDTAAVWQSSWYPSQGDTLQVKIGEPGNLLDCGLFEIDEIELELSPDTLMVKGIATAITKSLRTLNSKAFEKQSLLKIAQYFADKHKLKLTGKAGELQKITIDRKTQDNQTDIAFLSSLAKEYGLVFSVRGDQLVFMDEKELEEQESILTIDRAQMSNARFVDKTSQTYNSAVVSEVDVRKNKVIKWEIKPGEEG